MKSKLINFLNKAREFSKGILPMDRYVNGNYIYPYLSEVKNDLSILEHLSNFPRFEREQDETYLFILKKYKKEYCPCKLYKYFSFENQIKYLELRVKIDDVLRKDR